MASPINSVSTAKRRRQDEVLPISDDDATDLTFPRFLVVSANDGQPIKYSVFAIQKILQCAVGDVKTAKKLYNGSVLIEVSTKQESSKALTMSTWIDTPITVTAHRSLNSCRGVIRCRDFRDCSNDEILDALRSQGVTAVKHIIAKKNGKDEPTNTFILTFNLPTPPKSVKAAYLKIAVETFVPNPLRCYNCQGFGHGKTTCKRRAACAKCSQEGHQDTDCHNPQHCANCSGDHSAFSKDCPQWQRQRDITQIKFMHGISFQEARTIVDQQNVNYSANTHSATNARRTGVTYAQACTKALVTTACQTDLTWPLDSKLPIAVTNLPIPNTTCSESQIDGAVGGTTAASSSASKKNVNNSNYKPQPSAVNLKSKSASNQRLSKGSKDPIKTHNKYGSLDKMDNMDLDMNHPPWNGSQKRK